MGSTLLPVRVRLTVLDHGGEPLCDASGVPVHRIAGQPDSWQAVVIRSVEASIAAGGDMATMHRHMTSPESLTVQWEPSAEEGAILPDGFPRPLLPEPPLRVRFNVPGGTACAALVEVLTGRCGLAAEVWGPDMPLTPGGKQWPYMLWPRLVPEDVDREGERYVVTMLSGKPAGWGCGPYDVDYVDGAPGPLATPIARDVVRHMSFVTLAPPEVPVMA